MTLILSLACADGLVVASDSQATFHTAGQPVKTTETKLFRMRDAAIVWGASGDVGVQQKVASALEAMDPQMLQQSIKRLRPRLVEAVVKVQKQAATNYIQIDPAMPSPAVDVLISGQTAGEAWILEVSRNGSDQQHEARGFCAVGSGDILAYHACESLRHHDIRQQTVFYGQVLAYRVLEAAIRTAALWLGLPIQMWVIGPGSAESLTEERRRELEDTVALWKQIEVEMLAEAISRRST